MVEGSKTCRRALFVSAKSAGGIMGRAVGPEALVVRERLAAYFILAVARRATIS